MTIGVGHMIRIQDCQTLFDETLCNIFYYIVKVWTGNAEMSDILDAFETEIIGALIGLQTPSLTHNNLRGDDLTDEVTFFEQDPATVGLYSIGDTLPTLVAAAFRLNRTTKITRPGQKRFAGFSEAVMELNKFLTVGAGFTAIEDAIGANLNVNTPGAGDGVLTPVIIGRDIDGHLELGRYSEVSSASAIANVSSQVSRKPDR